MSKIKKGQCYYKAFKLLERLEGFFILCHGVCIGTGPYNKGKPMGHAWLENETVVIDGGTGVAVLKANYYKLGKVTDVERFTLEEAMKRALTSKHYGPWNPKIYTAEKWLEEL